MVPLRKKWCEIQHGKNNLAKEANTLRLGGHIQWYVANRHNILSVYNSRLTIFDITTIHRMSRDQQQQWVKHLDIAREA